MRIAALALFLLLGCLANAQHADNIALKLKPQVDTVYIQDFSDKLIIGVSLPHKFLDFAVVSSENKTPDLEYEPSSRGSIGGYFSYKWLGAGASVSIPQSDKDRAMYGKTARFYLAINGVNGTTIAAASKEYSTEVSYGNANVTLGYRFNAPRLLKRDK